MINFKTSSTINSINKNKLPKNNLSELISHEKNFFNLNTEMNNNYRKLNLKNKKSRIITAGSIRKPILTKNIPLNRLNLINNFPFFPNRLFVKIIRIINYTNNNQSFSYSKNKKINFINNKIIKLYTIFINRNKNIIAKNIHHSGGLEPLNKQILNNRINSFISTMSKKNIPINYFSLNKNHLNIKSQNLQISPLNKLQAENTMSSSIKSGIYNISNTNMNKKNSVGAIKFFIGSLSNFNSDIAKNQFLIYNYNKANKFNAYPFKQVFRLLTLIFLSMGCFISKPNIQVSYKPSINNQIFNSNNKELPKKMIQINDIIYYWSKKQAPNINLPLSLNNKVNYHKKVNIKLFYYIRSENPIFSFLKKLAYRYKMIQKLILNIYNSNSISSNHTMENMNLYLTDIKTKIRNEQKNIIKLNILRKYTTQFKHLGENLASLFNAEIELELIRLKKPYNNSNILVQNLSVESYQTRFVKLVSNLFHKIAFKKNLLLNKTTNKSQPHQIIKTLKKIQQLSLGNNSSINSEKPELKKIKIRKILNTKNNYSFPSYLSGMSVKLGGRTFKQRVIPRMTQKRIQIGSLNKSKVLYFDRARFTNKTKKGAYTFTVKIGHTFY